LQWLGIEFAIYRLRLEDESIPTGPKRLARNAGSGSGESHVDRATAGPTPDNPSLSLKKRLKRAASFDLREREVGAGEAEPVDADAGLPKRMIEDAMMPRADGSHKNRRVSA
jgi:hypothetical protein